MKIITVSHKKLINFNELDDIFFDYYQNNNIYEHFIIKLLDAKKKQITNQTEYHESDICQQGYYDKNKEKYFNFFTQLFGLFTDIYIDNPLGYFFEDLTQIKKNEIERVLNQKELSLFNEIELYVKQLTYEVRPSLFKLETLEVLLLFLKLNLKEIFFCNFHFKDDFQYIVISGDFDLCFKVLISEGIYNLIQTISLSSNLYLR